MDNDSPTARVERTFWTVWNYIAGAVNRFLRPVPANVSNDPNSHQESTVDSEPASCGHAEGDASVKGVDEEHPVASASLLGSSRPIFQLCTTEIDLGPVDESMQHNTQLSRGSEEGEGTREELFAETGSDVAGLLGAKDAKEDEQEENRDQKLYTRGPNETPESDEEHEDRRSQRFTGDAMSEDMEDSGRKGGAEEETERATKELQDGTEERTTTPDDLKEMDETTTKIQVVEEDDRMHREDEQELEAELTGLSQETEKALETVIEESRLSFEEEEGKLFVDLMKTEVKHSEKEFELHVGLTDENTKELQDGTEERATTPDDLKEMNETTTKIQVVEEDKKMQHEDEQELEAELTGWSQETEKALETVIEESRLSFEEEEGKLFVDSMKTEVKHSEKEFELHVGLTDGTDENTKELQDGTEERTTTPDDLKEMDETKTKMQVVEEDNRMHREDEQDLEAELTGLSQETEKALETVIEESRLSFEEEEGKLFVDSMKTELKHSEKEFELHVGLTDGTDENTKELQDGTEERTTKPDDLKEMDETTTKIQVVEEDDQMHRKDEQELEAELTGLSRETEKALETVIEESRLSFEEEEGKLLPDSMKTEVKHSEKEFELHVGLTDRTDENTKELQDGTEERATTPDDLKEMDETTTKMQVLEEDDRMHPGDEQELEGELTGLSQETEKALETVIEESRLSFEEEEGKLFVDSMETELKHSEKEFELHVGLTDGTDENTKELQDGTEERTTTPDDLKEMDETTTKMQVVEEDDQMHREDEQEFEAELTGLSQETEKALETVIEESRLSFEEEEGKLFIDLMKTEVKHSEKEFELHVGLTDENTKELQDGTEERATTPDDLKEMDETTTKIQVVEEDKKMQHEDEQELKAELTGWSQETEKALETVIEESRLSFEEEEGKLFVDSMETELKHSEKEFELHTGLTDGNDENTKELQDGTEERTTTPDDLKEMDETTTKMQVVEEDNRMHREDEQDLEAELTGLSQETEKALETLTEESRLSFEEEEGKLFVDSMKMVLKHSEKEFELHIGVTDGTDENTKELQDGTEERTTTPDDLKEMDETTTKIQVVEEDDQMHRKDEQDLEAEENEVKLCTIADVSLEDEDTKCIQEARVPKDEADTVVMHEEVENSDGALLLVSENENKSNEEARQVENQLSVCEELSGDKRDLEGDPDFTSLHELQMAPDKSGIVSEDELIVAGQVHVTAHRGESDKAEDESTLDETEQGAVIEEEDVNEVADNRTIDEAPEQEDDIQTEDSQEEDTLTGHVTCSEENAKPELHAVEFTDGEQEDVAKDTEVQTKTSEMDDFEAESHGTVIDEESDEVQEERLSCDVGNKESYMEEACTPTSVPVKPQGKTEQDISRKFKNILPGMCEGRLVVSQELNSPTSEETQEGVPEYNNEPGDENTAQRFLEVEGDCEEIPTTQLPEEVESRDPESLQNSGCGAGADYLMVGEHMEEEQGSTNDLKNSFDLVVEDHTGILHLTGLSQDPEKPLETVIEESDLLFQEKEGTFLVDSMKTGVEQEFETHVGLIDETETKELRDGAEELLVEYEIDEGLCDSKEADAAGDGRELTGAGAAEVQKMTETSFLQELVDAMNSNPKTTSLLEDITEFESMKQSIETEPESLEVSAVEMQDADMEDMGYGVEEETADDEMQNKDEMEHLNLQISGMAAELTTEQNEKENILIAELSKSPETKSQLSDEAFETSNEEMLTDSKADDGSMATKPEGLTVMSTEKLAKHVTESEGSYAEETVCSISEHQDVIDEEILDLWIQTISEDTDGIKQQEKPEQQMEIEPSNEEQNDIASVQTEKDKEQMVESELVSDTEMSSSTVESGFLDQSLSEWGTQNSDTQLLKSTSTGSFQGIDDMQANMSESAEVSTQQPDSGPQDVLMEETAETRESNLKGEESIAETGFPPHSGVTSPEAGLRNQESDRSEEKTDEKSGSQTETDAEVADLARNGDLKDDEEADVESPREKSALFKVEETEVEEEPLEMTAPDSPHEIKQTESGRFTSGSEASSEQGIATSESDLQSDTYTESDGKLLKLPSLDKPQPRWSEDEDEVDPYGLDFTAQRSRIAVKNPRVRPPKDPRSLLHMPSVEPTPSSRLPVRVPAGVPLGGLGIGIKLPGLGAGFPVLKKTRVVKDENTQETPSQEPETKPEVQSDTPKQDEPQPKPKWMPPRHPGFGNPLMSELKTKLKKTTKE